MKFCKSCGTQMADDQMFCPNCGTNQAAAPAPQYAPPVQAILNNSDWDGSVFDTFVNSLAASLIMTLTCFIATPWAICYIMKYVVSHAVIDGRRLRFVGTGGSLFGNWLKWLLLTVVTCGIYSFWVTPRLYKWIVSNIHYE